MSCNNKNKLLAYGKGKFIFTNYFKIRQELIQVIGERASDRYYNDFSLLNVWDSNSVYFVVRLKGTLKFEQVKELELPDNRHQHIIKDEIIIFTGKKAKQNYPKRLRRVAIWDDENQQVIELITNQMSWTANTISELYRSRWQIEIFLREIKQLLHKKKLNWD